MTYNGNVTFLGGSNTTTFTGNAYMLNVLNVGTSTSAGSILLFEERPIRFGGPNLQIRSKTGDNTTMVLEAINSRNIELKSANRITSYNVCYTKLLRCSGCARYFIRA